MYNLGEQFRINYKNNKSHVECVFNGLNYRITVLSESLIRIEYNVNDTFTDELTSLVRNRNFIRSDFNVIDNKSSLTITTNYFELNYIKGKDFLKDLTVKIGLRTWKYQNPEVRNYKSLIDFEGNSVKSLYSLDGFATIDDSQSPYLFEDGTYQVRDNNGVDIYLFCYKNDFQRCLVDYYNLTGYPTMLPKYAFGNWWSKDISYSTNDLAMLLHNFDLHQIPISVILFNHDWHIRNNTKSGFTFNKDLISSPYDVISYFKSKNIRVGLSVDPSSGLFNIDEFHSEACKYLQPDINGIIPFSILNPKWIDVYLKIYIHPLDSLGVDFYFIDGANNFGTYLLKNYHYYDINRTVLRPFVVSRYAGVCNHRYGITYTGESIVSWDTLKKIPMHIASAVNSGNCNFMYDIGGFHKGCEDTELFIRYVQLGVFSPILRINSGVSKYHKREPWKLGIIGQSIVTDYLKLRHRLVPYLYTENYNYHNSGIPLMRPFYYVESEMYDDLLYQNEYYFGSQLFVAPIVKGKDYVMNRVMHKFVLPEGVWFDFFNGNKIIGKQKYTMFYKDENYPVFAKAGAIIPVCNGDFNDSSNLEILVFPGANNEYILYEDDGSTTAFKSGNYIRTKIEYKFAINGIELSITNFDGKEGIVPNTKNYKIVLKNIIKPEGMVVYCDNQVIPYQANLIGNDFIIEVLDINIFSRLNIVCKGNKLEYNPVSILNHEIIDIVDDLPITTDLKIRVDEIIFSDIYNKDKRIAIKKLQSKGMDPKFVRLFLNLLEYVDNV